MSLKASIIPVTPLQQNCTIFWCDETQKGIVVDPGGDVSDLLDALKENQIILEKVVLTHGHFDHVGGAMDLSKATGVPIIGPHQDDAFITTAVVAAQNMYDLDGGKDVVGNAWLNDGDQITFGNITLDVIHTPGHTPGHVVLYCKDAKLAQVGDVLFKGSIGRTDFPRGDLKTLENSITQKLWPLGNDVTFIPGHGPTSTFGEERASNPFVGDRALAS
ncbi:MAG: MBL fold metallo-hydrolase [Magnetovibrio sp.]|nr:MBL fold metallo-hydrolase [Magnetovibrio sp.]